MRIALFHNLPSGGAKRHTYEQVRELVQRGHEIVEFAPTTADLDYCSFAPYVKEQRIFELRPVRQMQRRIPLLTPYVHTLQGIMTLRRTEQLNQTIAREIDADNFDLVFVKDCHIVMNPYALRYLSTPAVFQCHHGLRHRLELTTANSAHQSWSEQLKTLYYSSAQILYQNKFKADETRNIQSSTLVLTNSEFSRQLLSEHYQVNSHVIYPGINAELFKPQSVTKSDYVLCVGALIYSKGYRFLIAALAHIDARRRPKLFIAANSRHLTEEKIVKEMASKLGVELCIERITDDNRLAQVYNQAQAFVYAPMQEALGMAPLEAMACGTPVVAVEEGGVKETVLDDVTGWLVTRDPKLFAEKLEMLLSDTPIRQRMGQAGVEYVRRNWSWGKAVDKLEHQFKLVGTSYTQHGHKRTFLPG
jgi:glycosyltransferase involved in cell wall biosynthesis